MTSHSSIELLGWALRAINIPVRGENMGGNIEGLTILLYDGEHIIVDDESEPFSYWHCVTDADGEVVESNHGFGIAEVEHRLRQSL